MSTLPMLPNQIHVWLCWVQDAKLPAIMRLCEDLLDEKETTRWKRFHFEEDRSRFLLTRALVRLILSRYAPVAPKNWTFTQNHYGKPEIIPPDEVAARITFNVSHTRNLIAVAITTEQAIGIDVTEVSLQYASLEIANKHFSKSEADDIYSLPARERVFRFFEYWALKEAYVKARGLGLSIPLDSFAIELNHPGRAKLRIGPNLDDRDDRWRLWQLQPDAKNIIGLCVETTLIQQVVRASQFVPFLMEKPIGIQISRIPQPPNGFS